MEKAIKKAIEGGYKDYSETSGSWSKKYHSDILLDPLFWQALGKAEGWNLICSSCGHPIYPHQYRHVVHSMIGHNVWLLQWHDFIDWIAEGKEVDLFFKELLR